MRRFTVLIIFTLCLSVNGVSFAETPMNSASQISVPPNHILVVTPPVFETVTSPVFVKSDMVSIPPTYETSITDGKKRKVVLAPAKKSRSLIAQPYKTQSVRKVVQPSGYALENKAGEIVKRWTWVDGELIPSQ